MVDISTREKELKQTKSELEQLRNLYRELTLKASDQESKESSAKFNLTIAQDKVKAIENELD